MEYNEKYFAKSANKKAMGMWLTMLIVLSLAYVIEIFKGLKSIEFYLVLELLAWGPFIAGIVVLAITIIRNYNSGMNTPSDISNYEIQMASIVLCYIGYWIAIKHMSDSDGALLNSVKGNLTKVVATVRKVKTASNSIVDGVTVVRELSEENKEDASVVIDTMEDLVENSKVLSESINSSMDMTEDIDQQVTNMAELVEHIVELSDKSVSHARTSAQELEGAVEVTNTMARLSSDIEVILNEFQNQFSKVKQETGIIENISSQTNLLALNASIEAARAGKRICCSCR